MIEIVPYDPRWPARFEAERVQLAAVLAPWLTGEIQHVGSTAVPGLAAKSVIDIMAPVASLDASGRAIEAASGCGYLQHPYRADVMHWFCKPSPSVRTHHLYLVPLNSRAWHERLFFRDALRADPALARRYAELKLALASQHRDDREAYTEAKTSFVEQVLAGLPEHLRVEA